MVMLKDICTCLPLLMMDTCNALFVLMLKQLHPKCYSHRWNSYIKEIYTHYCSPGLLKWSLYQIKLLKFLLSSITLQEIFSFREQRSELLPEFHGPPPEARPLVFKTPCLCNANNSRLLSKLQTWYPVNITGASLQQIILRYNTKGPFRPTN